MHVLLLLIIVLAMEDCMQVEVVWVELVELVVVSSLALVSVVAYSGAVALVDSLVAVVVVVSVAADTVVAFVAALLLPLVVEPSPLVSLPTTSNRS